MVSVSERQTGRAAQLARAFAYRMPPDSARTQPRMACQELACMHACMKPCGENGLLRPRQYAYMYACNVW